MERRGTQRGSAARADASALAPLAPMEALLVEELPEPPGWLYEPKWDGFRAIVAREADDVEIWSKSGKPLGRFFPEIVAAVASLAQNRLLLDGELVVPIDDHLSFDALQARLHPAASRIVKLSEETPARLILFDCLRLGDTELVGRPLTERRAALETFHATMDCADVLLSPVSNELARAKAWLSASGGALDGVIAKPADEAYRAGERVMRKIKPLRTADCVVGGYRTDKAGTVASLLLGLYDDKGKLDLVGFTSAFAAQERRLLVGKLKPHAGGEGFTGKAPSGPSRWNPDKSGDYVPLTHELVAEVVYDQITGGRFRHGTRLRRWRPDKAPRQCTRDQLMSELRPAQLGELTA